MRQGYFITIEGGEGAGKTSAIAMMQDWMERRGYAVTTTREPGGIRIAEEIRSIILDTSNTGMDSRTEALLYAAARRQHLVEKVIPALQAGQVVLCDRFVDSSLVYQGIARGIGLEAIREINRFAIDRWMPDLTIYMDVAPEIGLARIRADREREMNRLDLEPDDFHRKVREGYRLVASQHPERIVTIDAGLPQEQVYEAIRRCLNQKLPPRV